MHARKTVKLFISALRSFLRYARYRGYILQYLEDGILPLADWSKRAIPRAISRQHIRQVLTHCDRRRGIGRRDYAILLLFARLGLRAGEVTSLTLDDIDWNVGSLQVRGKGSAGQLPLPKDVGQAIADYLQRGRPRSTCREVFLRSRAPAIGFKTSVAVVGVVARALRRAGIASPSKGSHQFRHALASELLRHGASLGEIGELLRHRNVQTTTIYAKVDLPALRTLAQPWMGGRS
jgi:site-specific recombinase XerD